MSGDSSFQMCDRLVEVLDAFTVDEPRWTLTRLANRLKMPRSTAHRYLHSLAGHALLECQADGSYVLGAKVLQWAGVMRETNGLASQTPRILADLALQTGETAFFAAECARDLVYLDVALGNGGVIVSLNVGDSVLAPWTAPAQAIAAYWPQERLDLLLSDFESGHQPYPRGLSRQALLAQLARVRSTGYAISAQELSSDSCMIAAPVMGETNLVAGSLGIACPLERCQAENPNNLRAVMNAAVGLGRYATS